MLIINIIITYNIDERIAKVLNAVTSIFIVAVLNSSITLESNNPYTNTKPNMINCATKYIINPNKTE